MEMYCCCGQKIRDNFVCLCDWDGWISSYDYPEERKNKDTPIYKYPLESGKYLVRYQTSYADRYEDEDIFSVKPIRIEKDYDNKLFPIHWQKEDFETYYSIGVLNSPYAWKKIEVSSGGK